MPLSTNRSTVHALEHVREFAGTCDLTATVGAAAVTKSNIVVTDLAVGDVILAVYPASVADIVPLVSVTAHTAYNAAANTAAFVMTSTAASAAVTGHNFKVLAIAKGF
jgi:hypothetical protein